MKSTRPSETAKLIARSQILASKEPYLTKLVPGDAFRLSMQILGSDWCGRLSDFSLFRRAVLSMERLLLPGIITHYLVRKLHIQREVEKALSEGCQRMVVIGAGYDTLAWRLHRIYPGIQFIEIDHPATQRIKSDRLMRDRNLVLKPLDLSSSLPSSILGHDKSSTVFVIEGLTMYLTPHQVEPLMRDVAGLAGKGGKIIWSFMEKQPDGSLGFRGESSMIARWLKFCGEPFLWGIRRSQLEAFSAKCGMTVLGLADHHSLRQDLLIPNNLPSLPLAQGELICTTTPV